MIKVIMLKWLALSKYGLILFVVVVIERTISLVLKLIILNRTFKYLEVRFFIQLVLIEVKGSLSNKNRNILSNDLFITIKCDG